MSGLKRATLQNLDTKNARPIEVQFNPSTLSLQMQNSTDGARSRGRQKQQYNGSASVTLSVDLEFDSTDLEAARADVRRLTGPVREFMVPRKKKGSKAAPPRVRFSWGTIEVRGTMESLTEELTYFSKDGVPLQSKLSIQIKGQDPNFDANQIDRARTHANTHRHPAIRRSEQAFPPASVHLRPIRRLQPSTVNPQPSFSIGQGCRPRRGAQSLSRSTTTSSYPLDFRSTSQAVSHQVMERSSTLASKRGPA